MNEQESKDLEEDICPVCYVDSNLCGCGYRWWESAPVYRADKEEE